jgi:hypothetical protein
VAVEWGTAPTPEIAVETEEEGRFTIALPVEGQYRLRATAPDGETGSREIEGGGQDEIVIELDR